MKFACLGYLIGMYTVIYQLRSKVQYLESLNLQYVEISPHPPPLPKIIIKKLNLWKKVCFNKLLIKTQEWVSWGSLKIVLCFEAFGNNLFLKWAAVYSRFLFRHFLSADKLLYRSSLCSLLCNRGSCLVRMGDCTGCVTDCTAALQLIPDAFRPLLKRAEAYETSEK